MCTGLYNTENQRKIAKLQFVESTFFPHFVFKTEVALKIPVSFILSPYTLSPGIAFPLLLPQTAQTVLVVVVVFCLSWLPHHIVHLWVEFGSFPLNQASFVFRMVAHCLAYSNSSVNPVIYAFLSENFRNSYKQVFRCRSPSECPLNDTRDLVRSRMETAPSTNVSGTDKGHDSQISKML